MTTKFTATIEIKEAKFSDGSISYDVTVPTFMVPCLDEDHAIEVKVELEEFLDRMNAMEL